MFKAIKLCNAWTRKQEKEPVEPGDAPRIGFGHREVVNP